MINPIYLSNKVGIPRIQTSAITVGTDAVTFTVPSNRLFSEYYNGLLLIKFNQTLPTGTTTTLPIVLSSTAGTQTVTTAGDANWTAADYTLNIHLFYYESNTSTLQLIA